MGWGSWVVLAEWWEKGGKETCGAFFPTKTCMLDVRNRFTHFFVILFFRVLCRIRGILCVFGVLWFARLFCWRGAGSLRATHNDLNCVCFRVCLISPGHSGEACVQGHSLPCAVLVTLVLNSGNRMVQTYACVLLVFCVSGRPGLLVLLTVYHSVYYVRD